MKLGLIGGAIAALALTSPALGQRQAITPSGMPDAVFQGTSVKETGSKIANHCMNKGWQITSQTDSQVVCEIPMNVLRAALTQMLIGNSYSTTPRSFVKFSVAQIQDNARVQANAWAETQMAFGQMRQQPYQDDETFNGLQGFMMQAGGELPPGTTFPGTYLGVDGAIQSDGKKFWRQVTRVFPGTPAAEAGLQAGDRITKIAGRAFKDDKSWGKLVNKFSPGVQFPITVARDGKDIAFQIEARTRPAVGTAEYEALRAAALPNPPSGKALANDAPRSPNE